MVDAIPRSPKEKKTHTLLRLTSLANLYQRRTLRVLYGNTQAYPYDAQLSSGFVRSTMFTPNGGTVQKAAIIPGLVAKKLAGEVVDLAANAWAASTAQYRPFGLFANYVGGEMTDIPSDFDRVGIWRGAGSVYELLAPSWDDTGLSSTAPDEDGTAAEEVYLVPNSVGQLVESGSDESDPSNPVNTAARLMTRLSANAIVIELLV